MRLRQQAPALELPDRRRDTVLGSEPGAQRVRPPDHVRSSGQTDRIGQPRRRQAAPFQARRRNAQASQPPGPEELVPDEGDQFFWAWRLGRLGVATPRLERRGLTAARLADAIGLAGTSDMVRRADALGARLRAEDGVAAAVRQLESWGLLPQAQARSDTLSGRPPGLSPAVKDEIWS